MEGVDPDDFEEVMAYAFDHLMDIRFDPYYGNAFNDCKNKHERCAEWAVSGRCYSENAKEYYLMASVVQYVKLPSSSTF